LQPVSAQIFWMTLPPEPMTSRILSGLIFIWIIFGAESASSLRGSAIALSMISSKDGLVKIKDLEFKRTEKVEDVLKIGDMTWVKVMNVDDRGRIDLSRKDAMREKGLM